jgi:hypothetical protein
MLPHDRLIAVAEDIEQFHKWWTHGDSLNNALIRQGSAMLRRLLVEDVAGAAWRQMGLNKSPTLRGPDLLTALSQKNIPIRRIAAAAAAGVRYGGLDIALMALYRVDNRSTGVSADADEGFAVANMSAVRKAQEIVAPDSGMLLDRSWFLREYLDVPGFSEGGDSQPSRSY